MYVLSGTSDDKPIMIEFDCGLTPLSFDRKLTLQADTGADMNAINKKTFTELFPDVEWEETTHVLQNFDKRLIKPIGSVYIGLPGVTGIADDMVIFGRNEEEHDRNLILFLETTRKNGLVLNKKKASI